MAEKDKRSLSKKEDNGLYLAYQTALEMADARNFVIGPKLSSEEFLQRINETPTKPCNIVEYSSKNKDVSEKIAIVFIMETKRGKKFSSLNDILSNKYGGQVVFILKDKPQKTGTLKTFLKGEQAKYNISKSENEKIARIDVFSYMSLLFNITKHVLQPKFSMVEQLELEQIVEDYTRTRGVVKEFKTRLPKMLYTDPIAEFYGMNIGDVVKVTRYDPQYNIAVTYRVII